MTVAIITGSAGLIGSEAAAHFAGLGMDVVGESHYPGWQLQYSIDGILQEIYEHNVERWTSKTPVKA